MRKKLLMIITVVSLWQLAHPFERTSWCSRLAYTFNGYSSTGSHHSPNSLKGKAVHLAQQAQRLEIPYPAQRGFFAVHYRNECHKTIWTAVHYMDFDGNWVRRGWWKLEPGDTAYVSQTRNSIYYTHAYSDEPSDKRSYWKGDEVYKHVRGSDETYGFRKYSIEGNFCTYTHRFTCE